MRLISISTIACLSLLASCGGSGGGSPGGSVALSQSNAQAAASAAFFSADGLVNIANNNGVNSRVAGGGLVVKGRLPARFDLPRFVRTQIGQLPVSDAIMRAIIVERTNCPNGGEIVETWNDADDSGEFSPGDTLELEFLSCVDEDMVTLNGRVTIDQFVVSGFLTGNFNVSIRMTFDQLTATDGTATAVLNGSLTASLTQTGDVFTLRLTVSVTVTGGDESYLGGTTIELSENETTNDYTLSANGGVSSTGLGGTLIYNTPVPFAGNTANQFPDSGQMIVRGANNSSITITVVDNTTVRIDIDEDGDGQTDATLTVTWSEMQQS